MANAVILPVNAWLVCLPICFHKVPERQYHTRRTRPLFEAEESVRDCAHYDVFRLTVDYSQSLEQMIAAGQYDRKNSDIIETFPDRRKRRHRPVRRPLLPFLKRTTSSKNAIAAMKEAGWEPANIEHLLVLGEIPR